MSADLAALAARGLSDSEIADRLGVSPRTVLRRRQRAGIPSQWAPVVPPHGTTARYDRPCRCDLCRRANARDQARYRNRANQAAPSTYRRAYEPWTVEEDRELLHGPGTVTERAQRLGRSYMACVTRLYDIRRKERVSA